MLNLNQKKLKVPQISEKKEKDHIEFAFECEYCTESWSENLLDLIDNCTPNELEKIRAYIENKLV